MYWDRTCSSVNNGVHCQYVFALVPDGTSRVTLTSVDGVKREFEVHDNLASGRVPGAPASVEWVGAGGAREVTRFGDIESRGPAVTAE